MRMQHRKTVLFPLVLLYNFSSFINTSHKSKRTVSAAHIALYAKSALPTPVGNIIESQDPVVIGIVIRREEERHASTFATIDSQPNPHIRVPLTQAGDHLLAPVIHQILSQRLQAARGCPASALHKGTYCSIGTACMRLTDASDLVAIVHPSAIVKLADVAGQLAGYLAGAQTTLGGSTTVDPKICCCEGREGDDGRNSESHGDNGLGYGVLGRIPFGFRLDDTGWYMGELREWLDAISNEKTCALFYT
jgi:hypothetical protein